MEPTALMAQALRVARKERGLRQADVALRLSRNSSRIAELENDLEHGRKKRDRLQLLLEMADSLRLVPMLVPRSRSGEVEELLNPSGKSELTRIRSVYEEIHDDIPDDL